MIGEKQSETLHSVSYTTQ